MEGQQYKHADSEQPDEYAEPGPISFGNFDDRDKAIQNSSGEEEVGEDPDMVIENDANEEYQQANEYYSTQYNQEH